MQKFALISVGIFTIVLLVLGSLTNVVGYQVIQSSNKKTIKDVIDQKELLFQTILDIANNREIQRLLLNSDIGIGIERSFDSGFRFSILTPRVFTKEELNVAYHVGLILAKTINTSNIQSILQHYRMGNQDAQKEISTIIKKNNTLNNEIKQIADAQCYCEKNNSTVWSFPVICTLLYLIAVVLIELWIILIVLFKMDPNYLHILWATILNIGVTLNCWPSPS